jgi:hypothetical protein
MREAFVKLGNDAELKADATKMMMDYNYTNADESLKVMNYLLSQTEDIIKEFSKFVKF